MQSNTQICCKADFIRVWEESETLREVATRLNLKPAYATKKAVRYRAIGIKLKYMPKFNFGDPEFIACWNQAESVTEVAETFGYASNNGASHHARRLRARGFDLKDFRRFRKRAA